VTRCVVRGFLERLLALGRLRSRSLPTAFPAPRSSTREPRSDVEGRQQGGRTGVRASAASYGSLTTMHCPEGRCRAFLSPVPQHVVDGGARRVAQRQQPVVVADHHAPGHQAFVEEVHRVARAVGRCGRRQSARRRRSRGCPGSGPGECKGSVVPPGTPPPRRATCLRALPPGRRLGAEGRCSACLHALTGSVTSSRRRFLLLARSFELDSDGNGTSSGVGNVERS
jgi:hypothetical protein